MSTSEPACDYTPRPCLHLPLPSEPLTRQRAVGAESPTAAEIVWPEQIPDYYSSLRFEDCGSPLSFEIVTKVMRAVLPHVRPYVKFIPRTDRAGKTFTLVLQDARLKSHNIYPIDSFGIGSEIAWEYIACDYLRHRYLGLPPVRLSKIKSAHFGTVLSIMAHFNALHDSLGRAILQRPDL